MGSTDGGNPSGAASQASGILRYVAIGDSQTEGLNDYDETGKPRGWADRFAESGNRKKKLRLCREVR